MLANIEVFGMSFGEKFQRCRQEAGFSQAELGRKAGIAAGTLRNWEQGIRCPVSADFYRAIQALGVSADVFASEVLADATIKKRKAKKRPKPKA